MMQLPKIIMMTVATQDNYAALALMQPHWVNKIPMQQVTRLLPSLMERSVAAQDYGMVWQGMVELASTQAFCSG